MIVCPECDSHIDLTPEEGEYVECTACSADLILMGGEPVVLEVDEELEDDEETNDDSDDDDDFEDDDDDDFEDDEDDEDDED